LLHIRFYHGDRKSVAECYGHSFAINDLYRGGIYIDCEWRYLLPVEYGSDNSKYFSKSGYDNNIFSNRNKFQWLFTIGIRDCFCGHTTECYCGCITIVDLCRSFIDTDRKWRYLLCVEYGSDNSKYFSKSGYDNNLFSNGN
jgi:hypothetical protein